MNSILFFLQHKGVVVWVANGGEWVPTTTTTILFGHTTYHKTMMINERYDCIIITKQAEQ